MSLQVWLPLTGHLNNQGLTILPTAPSYTNMTFNEKGKVGKYYGQGKACWHLSEDILDNQWSVALWYFNSSSSSTAYSTSGNSILFCKNSTDMPNAQIYLSIFSKNKLTICANDGNNTTSLTYTYSFARDTWYHFAATYDGTNLKLYMNGNLVGSKVSTTAKKTGCLNICIDGRATNAAGTTVDYGTNGLYNDVRLYNNAISAKEVKILSQALALHYPLSDRCIQQMNNCFVNPRFENGNTGWSTWGPSGSQGTHGTTTDKQWIYRKDQEYAKWIACAAESGSGKHFILYQSPTFSGGYRSLSCIIKSEDSAPITTSIAWPSWNEPKPDSKPTVKWDSVISLGNGFYYCKVDGFQQTGSNDLVCIGVSPGHKIYVSEAYLENDREICSDILFQTNTVYDTSGHQYNGEATTNLIVDNSSARYQYCLKFNGTSDYIIGTGFTNLTSVYTVSLWFNYTQTNSYQTIMCSRNATGGGFSIFITPEHLLRIDSVINADATLQWTTNYTVPNNEWHHLAIIRVNSVSKTVKYYIDGILKETNTIAYTDNKCGTTLSIGASQVNGASYSNFFKGCLSDIRIYRTAFSDSDVAELYNTAASLSNNGTLFAYSFNEV